jgi:hypothetical protein
MQIYKKQLQGIYSSLISQHRRILFSLFLRFTGRNMKGIGSRYSACLVRDLLPESVIVQNRASIQPFK